MKFGFMSEGETAENQSYYHRYKDLVREVQWAEEMGFDFFASSEQHFTFGATISAPECLYSYLFPLTTRLRFRHAVCLLPIGSIISLPNASTSAWTTAKSAAGWPLPGISCHRSWTSSNITTRPSAPNTIPISSV